mgnify:CR=1 FL=1
MNKILVFFSVGVFGIILGVIYQQKYSTDLTSPSIYNESLIDINNKAVHLRDFKGQQIVFNFWATWCEPCREEIPELNQFAKEHKNITLIGIAVDDLESVKKFQQDVPIEYLSLIADMDGVRLSQSLGNDKGVLPFTAIIDASGMTVKSFYGKVKISELNQALVQ